LIICREFCLVLSISAVMCLAALVGPDFACAQDGETGTDEIRIQSIEIRMSFSNGDVRPAIAEDLRSAIKEVAELAILDQLEGSLQVLEDDLAEVTEVLERVLDLTLDKRGFRVESLSIIPGEVTIIDLEVAIAGVEIIDVLVELVPPIRGELVSEMLSGLQDELISSLRRQFQGLPANDVTWITLLFNQALQREYERLPDFRLFEYRFELIPAAITRVVIYLTPAPKTSVVRRHFLHTRSSTLLNISLDRLREVLLVEMASLDGLPKEFIERHLDSIETRLAQVAVGVGALEFYDAEVSVSLTFRGSDLHASAIVESKKYRTSVGGRVDFNREMKNPRIEGTIGIKAFSHAELYAHLKFFPDKVNFEPEIGIGINPGKNVFVGGGWDFDREVIKLSGDVWFGTNLRVSIEHFPDDEWRDDSEYGITYQLNENFSISAIADGAGSGFVALGVKL